MSDSSTASPPPDYLKKVTKRKPVKNLIKKKKSVKTGEMNDDLVNEAKMRKFYEPVQLAERDNMI